MATRLDLADAQFIGYHHGKREGRIIDMVESMGLTKAEWKRWNRKYTTSYLTADEKAEIDIHFGLTENEVRKLESQAV